MMAASVVAVVEWLSGCAAAAVLKERERKRERCHTAWCSPALTYSDTQNQGHKLRATAVTVLGWTAVAGAEDGAGGEPGWAVFEGVCGGGFRLGGGGGGGGGIFRLDGDGGGMRGGGEVSGGVGRVAVMHVVLLVAMCSAAVALGAGVGDGVVGW